MSRLTQISRRPAWLRYGVAVVLTLAVVAGRMASDPVLGSDRNRHLVFLPTVIVAAFFGGFGPGLAAVLLSTAAIDYFWTSPRYAFHGPSVELVLFLLLGIVVCAVIESLHRAGARADAAKRSREHVLAIVAHDLRNPLNAIKMSAAQLRRMSFDAEAARRRLSTIDRSAARMEGLIRDLIDATRIEFGELTVALRNERVASIVEQTLEDFGPLAQEKTIELVARPIDGELTILCDRGRLLQVLGNLVGNALHFTPEGGKIWLRAEGQGCAVRFDVEDTGPGIKPQDVPHIFDRYWTASGSGTGLGLFIAQSIVAAHHGKLWVETEEGRGASFRFTIPCPPASHAAVPLRSKDHLGFGPLKRARLRPLRPRREGDAPSGQ